MTSTKRAKELKHLLKERAVKAYEAKEAEFPDAEHVREVERVVLLRAIDGKWMDHIDDMDQLRQGIGLQAYGQKDPLVEYKMLGYDMFGEMTKAIEADTIRVLFHIKMEQKVEREQVSKSDRDKQGQFSSSCTESSYREKGVPERPVSVWKRPEI